MHNIFKNKQTVKNIVWIVLGALTIYFFSAQSINKSLSNARSVMDSLVEEQKEQLVLVAEQASSNRSDVELDKLLLACSSGQRDRFYALLSRLDSGLSNSELNELEKLIARCGSYDSLNKVFSAMRLEQAVNAYKVVATARAEMFNFPMTDLPVWDELARVEIEESRAYANLVNLQSEIVTALLAGATPGSVQIGDILNQVNASQVELANANQTAVDLRAELDLQ